jgi:hypothetical protein
MAERAQKIARDEPPLDPVAAYKIDLARKGALARLKATTPEQRTALARKAANARWHGQRSVNGHG